MKKSMIKVLLAGAIVMIPNSTEAKEDTVEETKVVLSFALTAEDRFTYEVRVSEGGSLYDGSQKITNGIMEYQLSVGEKKEFRIMPDKGYEVKEIRKNEENLNTDIKSITVAGVSKNSVLEVQYGEIEDSEIPNIPEIPDESEDTNSLEIPEDIDKSKDTNRPESIEKADIVGNRTIEGKENRISGLLMITGDTLKIGIYTSLIGIVVYVLYVRRKGRTINTVECVDNKKTLKEEKKDEK